MGGEIAQVIASAGIPVVLKDVKQEFVDQGLTKAREVTQAQLAGLVAKEKITQEDADRQLEEILGRITERSATRASATSTSRSRPCRSAWRSSRRCSPSSTPSRPGHAILASNTSSLSITEMGEATTRPGQGRAGSTSSTRRR